MRWYSVSGRCRDCAVLARLVARSHRISISIRRLLGPFCKKTYEVTVRRLVGHGSGSDVHDVDALTPPEHEIIDTLGLAIPHLLLDD